MITKGTKIRLVKKMGVFDNIGEVCEVTSVSEDGIISFRFGGFHLGCMSYSEFEKYFEYVEEDTEKRELLSLFEWCKSNDKPFYPELYNNIIKKYGDTERSVFSVLGKYKARMCLAQYKDRTFKDSDFSEIEIVF